MVDMNLNPYPNLYPDPDRPKWQYPKSPPPSLSTVCIFTPHGHTFTFRNCTVVTNNETVLVFTYKAMSDGLVKTHTALKHNIVGWSISTEVQ